MGKIERLKKDGKCNYILIKSIFLKYAVEVSVLFCRQFCKMGNVARSDDKSTLLFQTVFDTNICQSEVPG